MEELNFEQIVGNTVSLAGHRFDVRACPDQYLGALSEIIGKPQFPLRVTAEHPSSTPNPIFSRFRPSDSNKIKHLQLMQ